MEPDAAASRRGPAAQPFHAAGSLPAPMRGLPSGP
jgi:hypothetical protein